MKISKEGLYVHIPFCNKICSYCNFSKLLYSNKFSSKYLIALKNELKKYNNYTFKSIYIGGGTPSSLSYEEEEFLFNVLLPYQDNSFIAIEINPDIEEEKIKLFKKYNVKRVSIGVQSFNKNILSLINRDSDFDKIKHLIFLLNKYDIYDINLDLMYGFKNQTLNELEEDLNKFTSLKIKHISTYCLQLEESTLLNNMHYVLPDDEIIRKQYDFIVAFLKKKGFFRYEVSNFAKDNYQSKHNLIYWNNHEYGGVGLNASSYINNIRRTNTKNLSSYLEGNYQDYEEILSLDDQEFYFIMLGLRKEKGISLLEYKKIFKKDFLICYKDKLDDLLKNKDLILDNDNLYVNEDKMFILDYFLRKLLF